MFKKNKNRLVMSVLILAAVTTQVEALHVSVSTAGSHGVNLVDGFVSAGPSALVRIDPNILTVAETQTLFESTSGTTVNAFHIRDNGNYLFSSLTGVTFGGLIFDDDKVIEYDPNTGIATVFYDFGERATSPNGHDIDIDAIAEYDGFLYLSNLGDTFVIDGCDKVYSENDVIKINLSDDTVSLAFDGFLLKGDDPFFNVSGFSTYGGTMAMSVSTGGSDPTSLFGTTFDRNDIIAYDPESGATWQVLDGNGLFSGSATGAIIDALHVEPEFSANAKECLFQYAGQNFTQLFRPALAETLFFEDYTFRYYEDTNTYLGFYQDKRVHLLQPDISSDIKDVGSLWYFMHLSGCENQ